MNKNTEQVRMRNKESIHSGLKPQNHCGTTDIRNYISCTIVTLSIYIFFNYCKQTQKIMTCDSVTLYDAGSLQVLCPRN